MLEALCSLLLRSPEVACILAKASASLRYTAGRSAVCNCTLSSYLAVRLLMLALVSSLRLSLPGALLDAEGWRWAPSIRKHRIDSLLLQHRRGPSFRFLLQATLGVENRRACPSGLPKFFNEALPVFIAEQFLPLVIGGSSSWNFPKAPVATMVLAKL